MLKSFQLAILSVIIILSSGGNKTYANESGDEFRFDFKGQQISSEIILSKYLQIESVSGNEKEAGEFLKNLCIENGLHITQMGNENGNYNFAASIKPLGESLPNIVFLNHIDVVPPGDTAKWTYPPFSGEITDMEIWGRGAFDNKGAAVMQLASVVEIGRKYKNAAIPYNVTFLAVSCEETQCDGGVAYVVDNYLDELKPAVVIGEGPPALTGVLSSDPEAMIFGISVAHKRPLWIKLEVEIETSGHGSVTPLEYANKEMVEALSRLTSINRKAKYNKLNVSLLRQLGDMERGLISFVLKHPVIFKPLLVPQLRKQPEMFSLFTNTVTLTSIDSHNDVINLIPNKVTALLDCRLLPTESKNAFLDELKRTLQSDLIEISVLKEMPEMKPSDKSSAFYQNLEKAIMENYPDSYVAGMLVPNFNDTGIFRSEGIPALSSIPVIMDMKYLEYVHNYNERIPRGILQQGKVVYCDFVEKCINSDKSSK